MFYVQSPDMFTLLQSNFIPQEEALLQVFGNFWYSLLSTWQNFVHTLANFLPVFKFSLLWMAKNVKNNLALWSRWIQVLENNNKSNFIPQEEACTSMQRRAGNWLLRFLLSSIPFVRYDKRDFWSSGYGRRLMFQRLQVRILAPYTGWRFFHIYLLQKL